jgi:hypothetical protein
MKTNPRRTAKIAATGIIDITKSATTMMPTPIFEFLFMVLSFSEMMDNRR